MGWIIAGIVAVIVLVFLWTIVHSAARSVDDDTRARQDEEQTRAMEEILRRREQEEDGTSERSAE